MISKLRQAVPINEEVQLGLKCLSIFATFFTMYISLKAEKNDWERGEFLMAGAMIAHSISHCLWIRQGSRTWQRPGNVSNTRQPVNQS